MRLLFVHDHRFMRGADGAVYTGGSFPAMTWGRYLRHFDDVVVVGRDGGTIEGPTDLARTDVPNVRFELIGGQEGIRLLTYSKAMDEVLDRELAQADALLAMLPSQIAQRAIQRAISRNVPFAAEVIGCAWDGTFNYGGLKGYAFAPIAYRRQQWALRQAPLALYVTREFLQQRYPCAGYTNYASNVEIEPMDPAGHRARDKRLAELAEGREPLFGTVGSLHVRYKGYQIAIPALAKLRSQGLDVRYAILGSGDPAPYRAIAEKHGVADLVEFAGVRAPGAGVAEWLDGIDVHMQPSFQEGLPRATVEAMNRGAACMGSTTGGLPELLSPDRMHRPGDVDALAADIAGMARDPKRIAATSRTDRETVKDFFPEPLQNRRDEVFSRLRRLADQKGR